MKKLYFLLFICAFWLLSCRSVTDLSEDIYPAENPLAHDQGEPPVIRAEATPPQPQAADDPISETPVALDPFVYARELVEQTPLPTTNQWQIIPCEGEAAYFCISEAGEIIGFAELLLYPLSGYAETHIVRQTAESLPADLTKLTAADRAAIQLALTGFANEYIDIFAADRAATYPDLVFTPLTTQSVEMGGLPALSFGFKQVDQSGAVIERYINIAAFDQQMIYWLGINFDPANVSTFGSDTAVTQFVPTFYEIAANMPIHSSLQTNRPDPRSPAADLPLLPTLREASDASGNGSPIPGGEKDPFAEAEFILAADLPSHPETAVVQQHTFGSFDEAGARQIADQLGFDGPLYIQKIPPEFAPPEGEPQSIVYTAFKEQGILNISLTGVAYENRAIVMDYDQKPVFSDVVDKVETQLHAFGLLDFPYELHEFPPDQIFVSRLIDGIFTDQTEFSFAFNHEGEISSFSFSPFREIEAWGDYPLKSADSAWQQLQTASGRAHGRLQMVPPQDPANNPFATFTNPRSWGPLSTPGQEIHLYITPAVYEATDGSGLRLVVNDLKLIGEPEELDQIAAHLGDGLHIWGMTGLQDGAKTLAVAGWEEIRLINYESLEGSVTTEAGRVLFNSVDGETFILPAAPSDIPADIKVHLSAAARRSEGLEYPLLDWMSMTEMVDFPDVPIATSDEDTDPIQTVTIDTAVLVYFSLFHEDKSSLNNISFLYLPVWKFSGKSDQGHEITFWLPAVENRFLQIDSQPNTSGSGTIFGWVWHDICDPDQNFVGQTSSPAGCLDGDSPIGDTFANGALDAHEPPIGGILIHLGAGACPSVGLASMTTIATDISYGFLDLEAGTYCISIDPSEAPNADLLQPGTWTFPEVTDGVIGWTVTLEEGQNLYDINFGWDHQFQP